MHLGAKNAHANYTLGGAVADNLGVLVDLRFSDSIQCQATANKASNSYKIQTGIKKGIYLIDKSITIPFYKTLVQPHLDYTVMF